MPGHVRKKQVQYTCNTVLHQTYIDFACSNVIWKWHKQTTSNSPFHSNNAQRTLWPYCIRDTSLAISPPLCCNPKWERGTTSSLEFDGMNMYFKSVAWIWYSIEWLVRLCRKVSVATFAWGWCFEIWWGQSSNRGRISDRIYARNRQ